MPGLNVSKSRFFWKLYLTYSLLFLAISTIVGTIITFQYHSSLSEDLEGALEEKVRLIAPLAVTALQSAPLSRSSNLPSLISKLGDESNSHISLFDQQGKLVVDSFSPSGSTESLDVSVEIKDALRGDFGIVRRFSSDIDQTMIYLTHPARDNGQQIGIIRLGYVTKRLDDRVTAMRTTIILAALIGIALALGFGMVLARRVTGPIAEMVEVCDAMREGRYDQRVQAIGNDEIGLLGDTLNRLGYEITKKIAQISQERTQLKTILAGMVEGIIAVSDDERVQFCNRAAYDLLDSNLEDCRGMRLSDLAGFNLLPEVFERARNTKELIETEIKLKRRGVKRSLEVHASAYRGERATGVIIVLLDVTRIKRLERVRRDFVANVSHEIKTPLTTIKGYTETLLAGALDDEKNSRRFIEKIDNNASRLVALVQDTLSLARVESQEEVIPTSATDWRPIVNQVLSRYDDEFHNKKLEITTNYVSEPVVVMGDRDAMLHIFDNLVTNAIRYTPEAGKLKVRLSKEGKLGVLEVEDTGIGIPKKQLSRVFERFYRVDKARSQELGGTGLGLAIVKHLVTGMNGYVNVDSEVGSGSTFKVYLNLV